MRKNEELEFSFCGAKGRAVGRFPIIILALLLLVAIAVIALLPSEASLFGSAVTRIFRAEAAISARGISWREQERPAERTDVREQARRTHDAKDKRRA